MTELWPNGRGTISREMNFDSSDSSHTNYVGKGAFFKTLRVYWHPGTSSGMTYTSGPKRKGPINFFVTVN
jgi:hypothetical protein